MTCARSHTSPLQTQKGNQQGMAAQLCYYHSPEHRSTRQLCTYGIATSFINLRSLLEKQRVLTVAARPGSRKPVEGWVASLLTVRFSTALIKLYY